MSDYSNALSGHPQPLETLRARVASVQRGDKKMLAWVHAVAEASEAHAHQLQSIFAKYAVSEQDLGTLSAPWDAVASVALSGANASATAARRLRTEVEQPLKQISSKYDRATSAIVADASFSLGSASEVQQADLERAGAVRDALLRLQTLFVDSSQEVQKSAERASPTLLNFNASDEPDSFVAQIVSGVAPVERSSGNTHSRGASQQTFVQHRANRKPSRMSLPDSTYSKEKKSGLRAKVGSIFRKPKQTRDFQPAPSPTSERAPSEALGRSASVRRPQQPTSTQAPDFGLRRDSEDEPLSVSRREGGAGFSNSPGSGSGAGSGASAGVGSGAGAGVGAGVGTGSAGFGGAAGSGTANAGTTILQPTPRHSQVKPVEESPFESPFYSPPQESMAEHPTPFAESTSAAAPFAESAPAPTSAPSGLPSVPPPRGGRKINSIYFSGVSAAPRESVFDIPEDRALDSTASLGQRSASAAGSISNNRRSMQPLAREITGPQTQQHPALPIVDGPAASVVESLTATKRGETFESVTLEGEIKFAANKAMQLQIINSKHLDSLQPAAALQAGNEQGVFSYDPSGHIPGNSIATYTGSFPALVPLVITPQWQVNDNQTRLIITYQLAQNYVLETAVLLNFAVAVSVTGGHASSAHAKPLATFSREKQRVTWRFPHPVEVTKATPQRLVCQFITDGPAHGSSEGVEARFEIQNAPTAIGLQTFGETGWTPVKTSATAYMQKYIVKSV